MSINFFSRIPEKAVDQIAQFTGEPQTLGNVCHSSRKGLKNTKTYEVAIRKGLSPLVGYTSERAEELSSALERTKIPFVIYSDDPGLKTSVEKIFQLLYSKKYFGSGEEACSFVLDSFARLIGPATYGQRRVFVKPLVDAEGQYNCRDYSLTLNSRRVPKVGESSLEEIDKEMRNNDVFKKQVIRFMSTIVHEMTHTLHHAVFSSFMYAYDRNLQEELGCTEKEYTQSLKKAADAIPNNVEWAWLYPFNLANEMRPEFAEPAKLVRGDDVGGAFTEFLARFPQMYFLYGATHSKEEVDTALSDIFALGHRVFWGSFKKKCEEFGTISFSKSALGELAGSPERLFSSLDWPFCIWATINGMPWVIYQHGDPKLSLQSENHLQKYDMQETLKKGCHCLQFIEPGRLALSTKFLETTEDLSKKSDGPSQIQLARLKRQLEREVDGCFRKDAQRDRERNRIPKFSQYNTGIAPYHDAYAKRLFQRLYADYRSPYFRGQDSRSEILEVFARLTRASDEDSVPFGNSLCIDLVCPPTDSSGSRRTVSDYNLSRCLDNGCHFYQPRHNSFDIDKSI